MGELGALFNPGMRHELEERRSKAMRREEEGNARDGDLRIDLESGVAVINVPGGEAGSADAGQQEQDRAGGEQPAGQTADLDQAADSEGAAPTDSSAPTSSGASDGAAAAAAPSADAPAADADPDSPAAPPQPRPRGKRGLAASSR